MHLFKIYGIWLQTYTQLPQCSHASVGLAPNYEVHAHTHLSTVDGEIFMLKLICVKIFMVLHFRGSFNLQIFLMVDSYKMDERLEHS